MFPKYFILEICFCISFNIGLFNSNESNQMHILLDQRVFPNLAQAMKQGMYRFLNLA